MSKKLEIYKCKICGNIVQVLFSGAGELVCCNEPMELLEPQYVENELGEKHVPQIETLHEGCETGTCHETQYITLRKHPMNSNHYIQMIEAVNESKNELRIRFFNPDENAKYDITDFCNNTAAFELCNIHGLWRNQHD